MSAITSLSVLVFLCVISISYSARILAYYPTPSISHQVVFRPLTKELIKRGHQVTVITADPIFKKEERPDNLTEVDLHDLSYGIWREYFLTRQAGKKNDLKDELAAIFVGIQRVIKTQFENVEVKKVLDKKNEYDLLIVEAFPRQTLVLSHIFKNIPMIQFSSFLPIFDNYHQNGIPEHELLFPTIPRRKLHDLTLWEKIQELYGFFSVQHFYYNYANEEHSMLKEKFGEDVPSFRELANNIDLLFLNIHPIFEGIRPIPPNVVHLYGIHQKPQKELPADLKKYLDSSKNGVIYISFGTNVNPSILPPERIQILAKVLSSLPYDVLWKWDKDEMSNKPSNVKIGKWFPQSDLLRHPKVKLFITQGGLQSTEEAIESGVPLLGMPMLGDQWFNVGRYLFLKIGLKLEMEDLTEDVFKESVMELIENTSYRQNIARLRSLMHEERDSPLDRAVWWIDYVLRNGGAKHLRSPGANMPWTEFFEIELVLTLLIGLGTVFTLLFFVTYSLIRKVFGKRSKVKKN